MDPYKDPDEFIKNLGTEAFQERIVSRTRETVLCLKFLKYWRKNYDMIRSGRKSFLYAGGGQIDCSEFPKMNWRRNNYIEAVAGRI